MDVTTYDWLSSAQNVACRLYDKKQTLSYQSFGFASLGAAAAYDPRMHGLHHPL
jgi:hypothetical protein